MQNKFKKNILLVSRGRENCTILTNQLNEYLGEHVEIRAFCVETQPSTLLFDTDLIVVATESILKLLKPELTEKFKNKIIVARRTINFKKIYKLLNIPPKTKVALVNDRKETAEEVISLLYGMGFNHLWLIPVYPGLPNIPRVKIAVTPGERNLVPSEIENIIDIGTREIDVSTLLEILYRFNLLDKQANIISAKYLSTIIDLSRRISENLNHNEKINLLLKSIIQKINNGVIATDNEGKITIFNKSAEKIFNIKKENVLGLNADEILPGLGINKPLKTGEADEKITEYFNGKPLLLNRTPLKIKGKLSGSVLTCYEFSEVEKIEMKLRGKLHSKGHIARYSFNDIVGKDQLIKNELKKAKKFAPLDTTVLISGETGTGKELVAHAIHNASPRRNKPFVAINCAALPRDLLESELFGFEEGTFTGAKKGGKPGLFEQAHLGTIFLDEIGEIPQEIQVKLLRVLESREVMRIGSERLIPIDVRVISATNQNLKELVREKKFREDLYFRLNVLTIKVPPLRERRADILLLLDNFLSEYGKSVDDFLSKEAQIILKQYKWPGNIRELKNVVEYLIATVDNHKVTAGDLPIDLKNDLGSYGTHEKLVNNNFPKSLVIAKNATYLPEDIMILKILHDYGKCGYSLGRRKLKQLMNEMGIEVSEDKVRARLKMLHEKKLVNVYKGRRGTSISEQGKNVLQNINLGNSS